MEEMKQESVFKKFIKFSDEFPRENEEIVFIEKMSSNLYITVGAYYIERSKKDFEECYIYSNNYQNTFSTDKTELKFGDFYWMYAKDFKENVSKMF